MIYTMPKKLPSTGIAIMDVRRTAQDMHPYSHPSTIERLLTSTMMTNDLISTSTFVDTYYCVMVILECEWNKRWTFEILLSRRTIMDPLLSSISSQTELPAHPSSFLSLQPRIGHHSSLQHTN